jgi:hypothetical protein
MIRAPVRVISTRSTVPVDPSTHGRQPYPQYAPRPPVNGLAIASLVLGIVCCVPPLGLILGMVALRQIRRKGQRGKGMAVAGTVLSAISTALVAVALATGGFGEVWGEFRDGMEEASRSRSTQHLRKGDCFNVPGGELERETASVGVVDCDEEHDAEISGGFTLEKSDRRPGEAAVEPVAERRCQEINDAYVLDPWALPAGAEMYYYMPSKRGWRIGDRTVTCAFADPDGKLKGSLRSDAGTLDAHQLACLRVEAGLRTVADEEPADEFAEDPQSHQGWARQTARTLRQEATVLHAHSWPTAARGPAEARLRDFDRAAAHWDAAAKAETPEAFRDHRIKAEQALGTPNDVQLRAALGLAVARPPEP